MTENYIEQEILSVCMYVLKWMHIVRGKGARMIDALAV